MNTGRLLFNVAIGYSLHPDRILRWGLPGMLCWPILRQMPAHHVWQFHQAVYRVIHDIAFSEDEYIALNDAVSWYSQSICNYPSHADHDHTVITNEVRKGDHRSVS